MSARRLAAKALMCSDGLSAAAGVVGEESHGHNPKWVARPIRRAGFGSVSYLNRKGQFVTYPMWVDFDAVSSPIWVRRFRIMAAHARSNRAPSGVPAELAGLGLPGLAGPAEARQEAIVVACQPEPCASFFARGHDSLGKNA